MSVAPHGFPPKKSPFEILGFFTHLSPRERRTFVQLDVEIDKHEKIVKRLRKERRAVIARMRKRVAYSKTGKWQ